jgi:hypothetical protein
VASFEGEVSTSIGRRDSATRRKVTGRWDETYELRSTWEVITSNGSEDEDQGHFEGSVVEGKFSASR